MARRAPMRTVVLLSACQAIIGSQQGLIMAIAALVGVTLAPDPALATLPTTSMVVGLALFVAPAAYFSHRLGRQRAFVLGAVIGILAAACAAMGIFLSSFYVFIFGLLLAGAAAAFGQQYRFAAADAAPQEKKGKAISIVLLGGVFSAFIGPGLAAMGRNWVPGAEYAGSFIGMAGLSVIGIVLLANVRLDRFVPKKNRTARRSLLQLASKPEIFIPIITGIASYGLMTFVMVAAPLAMVVVCGHSKESAAFAIQWHMLAMFAPSFFTGSIIEKLGVRPTIGLGLAMILACAMLALNGTSVWHFDLALILLGLGWNFGFVGSTTLLAQGYEPEDAPRVQAMNEQFVFGIMAIASISSGYFLQTIGWQAINMIALPVATIALIVLAWGDWRARSIAAG